MLSEGWEPNITKLIRIDQDPVQIRRNARADIGIVADASSALEHLSLALNERKGAGGRQRAEAARDAAWAELSGPYREISSLLSAIAQAVPGCRFVGDSTQPVYAGNAYFAPNGASSWFNSATGFGTLGYGVSGAIGAALADPTRPVICLIGDGGLQFCLAELGAAVDENTPVVFVVWNNAGYGEIESFMIERGIAPIGVRPSAPDYLKIAEAYGLASARIEDRAILPSIVQDAVAAGVPTLIDVTVAR